ncbi:MAG: hypothetical protein P8J20_05535 [Novosphingobium sp.]|nr:hypothetical protein [Novosphingobium sp.]
MDKIADYTGKLLNHVEALYRPGERQLAIDLAEALGCAVSDTGFTGGGEESFLGIHPNPDDQNVQNNVFYISPMRPEQLALEDQLQQFLNSDTALQQNLEAYREAARTMPFGVSHFSLRYHSGRAVQDVADRVRQSLGERLGDRLHVRVFQQGDPDGAGGELAQGFVYQDVIVSGSFLHGQLIELQSQPVA